MPSPIWELAEQTAQAVQYGTFELVCKVAGGAVVALEVRNQTRKWSLDDAKALDNRPPSPVE